MHHDGFPHHIKQFRKARGLTQAELAERSGYGLSTIRKVESGVLHPSKQLARALTTALKLNEMEQATLIAGGRETMGAAIGKHTDTTPQSPFTPQIFLPAPMTRLIGREDDVHEVGGLLKHDDVRLLTLHGTAGVGKTRLALAAAAQVGDLFRDGVYFIPLAAVADPALVPGRIAQPFGVQEAAGQPLTQTLINFFRDRQVLLVLDNLEHLLSSTSTIGEILAAASQVTILVTSRIPLQLYGEYRYHVAPLATPDTTQDVTVGTLSQFPGTELFVQRAQAIMPHFHVTPPNAPSIAAICQRLGGLPLAIELAAARIPVLPPAALLDRLDQQGTLLLSQARDLPQRLQTLQKALDWSYNLLDVSEQTLFRRLAVFAGGWTLSAAEAICGNLGGIARPIIDVLTALIDHSLLLPPFGDDANPRFRMLEPIREYAHARLIEHGELTCMQREHACFFLSLATMETGQPPHAKRSFTLPEQEYDNVYAAHVWARRSGDMEMALRLALTLAEVWFHGGHWSEGRDQLQVLLREVQSTAPATLRAALHLQLAKLHGKLGDYQASYTCAREALRMYEAVSDTKGCAQTTTFLGSVAVHIGDYSRAKTHYEEGLMLYQHAGDTEGLARLRFNLWILAARQSDFATGREHLLESMRCFRELGDEEGLAHALTNLGAVRAEIEANYNEARALSNESVALYRKVGDIWGLSYALNNLGEVLVAQQLPTLARACFEESLAIARSHKNAYGIGFAHLELGNLAWQDQDFATAHDQYTIALDHFRVDGNTWHIATALQCLARGTQSMGDDRRAAAYYTDSLRLHWEMQIKHCLPMNLAGLAYLAAREGRMERAARLQGANDALVASIEFGMGLFYADRLLYENNVSVTRRTISTAQYCAWYAEGQRMQLDEVVSLAVTAKSRDPESIA